MPDFSAFRGVATLAGAGPEDVAAFWDPRETEAARRTRAGAVLCRAEAAALLPLGVRALVVDDPRAALAAAVRHFHGATPWRPQAPSGPGQADGAAPGGGPAGEGGRGGQWPQAGAPLVHVAPGADVAPGVTLFPFAYVGPGAVVGAGTVLETGARVMDRALVGRDCRLGAGAHVGPGCRLGDRVVLGPNAVAGGEGFGFAGGRRVPHAGIVVLEDDVELGACACVDRAVLGETRIERGAKLDNLVHVAHNVRVGPGTVVAAQSGISGSAVLGAEVALGGQVGVSDHARLGDRVRVAAQAGVPPREYPAGAELGGSPAVPAGEWRRVQASLRGLVEMRRRVAWLWARRGPKADDTEDGGT